MVFQVGLGVSLGGVCQIWVLGGIPYEEDRRIEADPIQVALVGLEFDSDAMGITRGVC